MNCPEGVRIYFRAFINNQLVASDIPLARSVDVDSICFTFYDAEDHIIAYYPVEYVACVLPLTSVGPAGANQQS